MKKLSTEDILAVIGDLAEVGARLQRLLAMGAVSGRTADACEKIFTEMAELSGAADPANAENDV